MLEKITPEMAGIPSENIAQLISLLEKNGCATHSLLMMKGDKLFAEHYWKPFHKDFLHRQYSQTKSFVGVAIGLLAEDGKLSLDDPIVSHFPEKLERPVPENLAKQTVRHMLTMCTCGKSPVWFTHEDPDRTHLYLNGNTADHLPGMRWTYDSTGSQVLCALVEKLSGMSFFDFMYQRIFRHIGAFSTAKMLKCKNGDSWGDSAMLCTARDMAAFGRFVMNYGTWNGKRLMSESYLREATSPLVNNDDMGFQCFFRHGYGYQIWVTPGGFAFNGMGDQVTLCIPEKDLILVVNSDNQGHPASRGILIAGLYDKIIDPMTDGPLPEAPQAEIGPLELACEKGSPRAKMMEAVNGRTYICQENSAGIRRFFFSFDEEGGWWHYTNAQGDKSLRFGWNKNAYGKFPQDGYSTEHGGLQNTEGYRYDCAVSAAWHTDSQLTLRCQIIDEYFGNFSARFAFSGDMADVAMVKAAEHFLNEYTGAFTAKALP